MLEIQTALTTSLHNVDCVLKKTAASLFGYAIGYKSIALSDSKVWGQSVPEYLTIPS